MAATISSVVREVVAASTAWATSFSASPSCVTAMSASASSSLRNATPVSARAFSAPWIPDLVGALDLAQLAGVTQVLEDARDLLELTRHVSGLVGAANEAGGADEGDRVQHREYDREGAEELDDEGDLPELHRAARFRTGEDPDSFRPFRTTT